jgi:hypothetical protein
MRTDCRTAPTGPSARLIAGWTTVMLACLALAAVAGAVVIPVLRTGAVLDRSSRGQLEAAAAVRELGCGREALRLLGAYLRAPDWLAGRKTEAASLMCTGTSGGPSRRRC